MHKRWFKVVVVLALILLPVGIGWFGQDMIRSLYRQQTDYPKTVTIAAGAEGGRYQIISKRLQQEIEKLGVEVEILSTEGSLANLLSLESGNADFALYQPATIDLLDEYDSSLVRQAKIAEGLDPNDDVDEVAFIANLYMQPVQFIARQNAEIEKPNDLKRLPNGQLRNISVGLPLSGDHAMSRVILEHFGLKEDDVELKFLTYDQVAEGLLKEDLADDEKLDAALNALGRPAPVLKKLLDSGKCNLLEIPFAEALAMKHVFLTEFTIPAGLFHAQHPAKPPRDIKTVATTAQLLTHKNMNSQFVREVTGIVLDKHFERQNNFLALLEGGEKFAQARPDFAVHRGAQSVYDPEFDIHLVESWEAAYSLLLSIVIAIFFGARWLKRLSDSKTEHRLDQYIQSLLDIEGKQVDLDQGEDMNDLEQLQHLLDELTFLRQKALREFSVHDLNEDRGVDCFIVMCHELSNKINAKISRLRLDTVISELIETTRNSAADSSALGGSASAQDQSNI